MQKCISSTGKQNYVRKVISRILNEGGGGRGRRVGGEGGKEVREKNNEIKRTIT